MVVGLALLSAFIFSCGVVLQQRSALDIPVALAARPGLLLRLTRRPTWLLGLGADVIGFGVQTLALRRGSLVVVQPLVAGSLLFTLVLIALVDHEPISAGEWAAIGIVLVGLAVFLAAGSPGDSPTASAGIQAWLLCTLSVALLACVAVSAGLRAHEIARARWFGLAAGVADAFMAVLAKSFADSFGHGVAGAFATWTPYALVAGGLAALLLTSTAYQAGHPTRSLPIITVADPVFGSVIGITLFDERLRLEGVRGPFVAVSIVLMGAGLFALGGNARIAARVGGSDEAPPVSRPAETV
jgi:drug/metabolite transporter (DMT)-like permease